EGSAGGSGRARGRATGRGTAAVVATTRALNGASTRGLALRATGPRLARMETPPSPLVLAHSRLLLPAGLDATQLDRMFGTLLGPGIDFGDLYFQHSRRESWSVEDGIVKDGAHSIEQGVGVRAISGEKTGFAYSDDINGEALLEAARTARAIARDGGSRAPQALAVGRGLQLY